jgi:hypothetical protein
MPDRPLGSSSYRVDADDRIVSVDANWCDFARANGAPECDRGAGTERRAEAEDAAVRLQLFESQRVPSLEHRVCTDCAEAFGASLRESP